MSHNLCSLEHDGRYSCNAMPFCWPHVGDQSAMVTTLQHHSGISNSRTWGTDVGQFPRVPRIQATGECPIAEGPICRG